MDVMTGYVYPCAPITGEASMHAARADHSLESTLDWAMNRMKQRGFVLKSQVALSVDPKLAIMGYAKKEGASHRIVISEWALDSEMLGGLILHELAHIYFAEMGAHSHDPELLENVLQGLKERDGLRERETEFLIDAFNHLQNILVDDIVFAVMDRKELENAKRFFSEWVSEKPSGDPVVDAALLTRNAFAIASLKRRDLLERESDLHFRCMGFVTALGQHAEGDYDWLEGFLVGAKSDWERSELLASIEQYFERVITLMRASARLDDLR